MTCASCVGRVERRLNKLPGVRATVNLPLESAHLELTQEHDDAALIAAVSAAGYNAELQVRWADRPAPGRQASGDPLPAEVRPQGHRGYEGDIDLHGRSLLRRLIVAVVLSIPITVVSMAMPLHHHLPGWYWWVGALTLPVATWCGWPFHKAAFKAARHGTSTMDTLVSIGVIAAMVWSLVWSLRYGGQHGPHQEMAGVYYEVAAVVIAFLLAGRYAEHRSRRRAGDALRSLLELGARHVERLTVDDDGAPLLDAAGQPLAETIAVEDLAVGDVFAVRPGAAVATDGMVLSGTSAIDASMVTGEPVPVDVAPGTMVVGGTLNTTGYLTVRAGRVGADTTLARIHALVTAAQTGKAPIARLGDRISAVFVPIVLVIAAVTLTAWLVFGNDPSHAFTAAVTVLIIACPCALGLATPTAILVGTGRGAQLGVLIKGPEILERTRRIDTVVLDKTGTVTEGRMTLHAVHPAAGVDAAEALRLAGAVEALSEHPIAQAIAAAASSSAGALNALAAATPAATSAATSAAAYGPGAAKGPASDPAPSAENFRNHPGGGVTATVDGHQVQVGRLAWLIEASQEASAELVVPAELVIPAELAAEVAAGEASGATAVVVAWDGQAHAVLELTDQPKPTSAEAVAQLKALGLRPVLLTGDSEGAAQVAASAVGIDEVIARVLPAQKANAIKRLQADGKIVAMIGDGVNDAAALATADLGLAMGTGTDAAIEAADLTLVRGDLRSAATAVRLSRKTLRIIKENLFWAFAYNVAALPLAAAGVLNPMIAGGAMALSSVLVVGNSLRLRRAS
ncbi:MAG: heavy metal translocating P-type ATPase [Promicromonosporaceae bacterium]|nr:heavy metal translocating P-type ATPase [Promicromonosporaceae bacterium]